MDGGKEQQSEYTLLKIKKCFSEITNPIESTIININYFWESISTENIY
jgi:hypothetical protein